MQRRHGFTLVEMLVAMALTLFIMVIITQAFTAGLETFRGLKSIGDMQESLRLASQRLRADLQADHFDTKKRLSDPLFADPDGRPVEGFFRIEQDSVGIVEGQDLDVMDSVRAADHRLHFSVKLRGNRTGDFLTAIVPPASPLLTERTNFFNQPPDARFQQGNSYSSQWAEVAYYLVRSGSSHDPEDPENPEGTPLYSLYRVQRVVVPDNAEINGKVAADQLTAYAEISCESLDGATLHFNTPADLAQGRRSFNFADPVNRQRGASLLLTNVVTFRVQVLPSGAANFTDVGANFPAAFDTATAPARISAIKITMRIWDEATLQSRQVTIIQDM